MRYDSGSGRGLRRLRFLLSMTRGLRHKQPGIGMMRASHEHHAVYRLAPHFVHKFACLCALSATHQITAIGNCVGGLAVARCAPAAAAAH